MAIDIGAVRASASFDAAGFETGVRKTRSALNSLEGVFHKTTREAVRSSENAARAWGSSFDKTTTAAQAHINALTGVDRATKGSSSSAKYWAKLLDQQAQSYDRLRASIDPVFASSKQYEAAVAQIEGAVRSGIVTQSEANRFLEQAAQKYLGLVPAAQQAAEAQEKAAREAQRMRAAYETTRASIDPLYASSKRYEAVLDQTNAALAAGVISQREANSLLAMAEKQYLGTGEAAAMYGKQAQTATHHTANLAYQFNDIGMMMAAGQSPFMLALQQGTQVSQVLNQMGGGAASVRALGGAFLSVINPTSLVTIGVIAGAAALGQWAMSALGAEDKTEALAEAFDALGEAAGDFDRTADIAQTALSDLREEYGQNAREVWELHRALVAVRRQQVENALANAADAAGEQLTALRSAIGDLSSARRAFLEAQDAIAAGMAPLPSEVKALEEAVAATSATLQEDFGMSAAQAYRLRDALDQLAQAKTPEEVAAASERVANAISSSVSEGAKLSDEVLDLAVKATEAHRVFSKVEATTKGVKSELEGAGNNTEFVAARAGSWARSMYDVRQEVLGILSALGSMTDGLMDGAAKQAELAALRAGKSLAAAKSEAAGLRNALALDQQVASLEDRFGVFGVVAGGVLRVANRGAQNLDANLEAARAAAREAERAAIGGGAATKSAVAALKAELSQRQKLLGLTGDQRRKYEALISIQQRLGKEGGKVSKAQLTLMAEQLVQLEKAEERMQRVAELQAQWSQEITRTAFEGGSLGDTIEGMLRDIAYQFAHAKIVLPVVASVTGILGLDQLVLGGGGAAQVAGAAGGGGGLLNLLGSGANLLSGGGFIAGVGSGLGGILSGGGLGASFANLGGLVSGASGFSAGALGAALPALGIIAGGIAVLSKAFSRKYRGSGLDARLSSEGLEGGRLFDFYKGGFFRSDKWVHKALPQELAEALDASMKGAAQTVLNLSAALDLSTEGLKDMEGVAFSIWTSGKSQEEIQRLLEEQVTRTANEMAKLILTEEDYIRASETHLEALQRLGTSLLAANDALDLLSHTLFDVSAAGGDAASGLVDAFGGADAMTAAVNAYFAAFYTAEEQAEAFRRRALERLGEQFDDLGLSLPRSRAEFRALVESVDLTSEAGRELYAQLLSLSGAMDQVLPKVSAYTEVMQGIVDQIGGEIGVQIGAARDMARITEQSAQLWYRTATTLRDFLSDLLNTDLTAASRSQTLAVNRSRFETAFDMARGGDVEAARDIPELAKAYLNSARANASTSLEYRRIAAAVQGQVNFLAGLAELEGANEDVLRGLYEQQIEVLTGLGQFLQLEGLTDGQVGQLSDGVAALAEDWDGTVEAFENSLGALEEAIRTAEAFSYDDLVGSLDVAVSLADNAPAWVQRLVDRADSGIRTSLDFIIRNNELSPDMRWLAVNSLSEHVKSLDFVLRHDVDGQTRRLALAAGSELRRNISFILKDDLTADQTRIALAGNSELSRIVTVSLGQADARAVRLALANVGSYAVTVSSLFAEGGNQKLLRRMLGGSGSYAAMLDASLGQLKGSKRRILLDQQGHYLATIRAAIADDRLTGKARALLLNSETRAIRKLTIQTAGLDRDNRALIEAIRGGDSLITLAGRFKFAPEATFKTWYSDRTKSLISTPMGKLGGYLNDLREAVDADRKQREVAQKLASLQVKGAEAAAGFEAMNGQGIIDQIRALERATGVRLNAGHTLKVGEDGQIQYSADHVVRSAGSNLDAWRKKFWADGGLEDQIFAYNRQRTRAQERVDRLREQVRDLGEIPAFANGGTHRGGLARVGENDIELVAPSRIYNPRETRAMLDNRDVVAELRKANTRLESLEDSTQQLMLANIKHAKRSGDALTRFERDPGSLKVTQVTE
ncbi:phage tail length tape measure family protein [Nocardioides marinus]|nr:phage tail length tape measure family protein [Nocardioides marinus]